MMTVIIISYNSFAVIERCQAEILNDSAFRFLIIDNASPDGSAEKLRARFPRCEVISLDKNVGYGRAANIGFRQVKTPYALLLNPDLIAKTEDLERFLRVAERDDENTALWGPALSDDPFTGQPIQYVDKISGCAMLFDLRKVQSVGFFDENIFLFFEENDLCLRIIQAGLRIGLCRQIRIQHLSGKASPVTPQIEYLKNWHYGWSYSYFVDKHGVDAKRQTVRKRYWRYRFKSWLSLRPIKRLHYRAKADGVRAFIRGESAFTAALRESDIRPSRKSLRPRTNDA